MYVSVMGDHMINNRYSRFNEKRWFLWSTVLFLIVLISCIIYMVFLYIDLKDSKTAGFEETKKQILSNTSITSIEEIEQFNGNEAYHVIYGKNKDNDGKIIFYPLKGKEKNLTTIDQTEIITKKQVLSQWKEQCKGCELVKIVPALVKDKALWEITYNDKSDRYVLDYVSLYDGSRYEQYRFKRMFK